MKFPRFWSLPLLAKELIERASRKRTYWVRVIFAALLYAGFLTVFASRFDGASENLFYQLGQGREMFYFLIGTLITGIALFVPAMTVGLITIEKERDSLALLFLTRLSPGQILLQKFFGGLLPNFALLLTAAPLMAVTYAFGGIGLRHFVGGVAAVTLACVQVVALALMCSARCRTTVAAFLMTYLVGAAVCLIPFAICELLDSSPYRGEDFWAWSTGVVPWQFLDQIEKRASLPRILASALPAFLSILVFLALARYWLVRRAFVSGKSVLLVVFRALDGLMQRLNHLVGNVQWGNRGRSLPDHQPVAWREMSQKALARPQYLVRMLLVVEIPVVFFSLLGAETANGYNRGWWIIEGAIIAGLATLVISVNAANAFVSERVQQTLDVLLTTPLSAVQIVREKAQVMRRLLWVAATPLLTIHLVRAYFWGGERYYQPTQSASLYLTCALLTLLIYLPLVSWLSLWIGLMTRTRLRAITTALAVIVAWSILPIFIGFLQEVVFRRGFESRQMLFWFMGMSPAFLPFVNEQGSLHEVNSSAPWLPALLSYLFFGSLLLLIRNRCLRRADYYLRR